jgi:hypothetical protein
MAPQSVVRGAPRSGDRAGGCADCANISLGRRHPATGLHLPLEDTASPFAVTPFASSLFAHPIPQSRRCASGTCSGVPL